MSMDSIGWYIATAHQLLGHDTAAAFIGQPPGDKSECILCRYEASHSQADRLAVIAAIGQGTEDVPLP